MSLALDTSTSFSANVGNTGGGNPSTATWSHTCTGNNRLLIVGVGVQGGTSANLLGVTYNGVAMTQIVAQGNIGLYYLLNPASGANNIVASIDDTGNLPAAFAAVSYTGASVDAQVDSFGNGTGASSTGYSRATTVVNVNCWLVGFAAIAGQNNDLTAGTGTTKRKGVFGNGNNSAYILADSNGTVSTGSQALAFVSGAAGTWNGIVASIKIPGPISVADVAVGVDATTLTRQGVLSVSDTGVGVDSASAKTTWSYPTKHSGTTTYQPKS